MKYLSKVEVESVGGAMDLPPFDVDNICVGTTDGPTQPSRSDYPAGEGGDAAYRYAYAQYNNYIRRTQGIDCMRV